MRLPCILPAAMQTRGSDYYTTYDNHQISGVDMHQENLDGTQLIAYAPVKGEQIYMQN